MGVLPLLADGSCQIQGTCLKSPGEAHPQCPQSFKCGTCVAWSPREENGYSRNSGECMLHRDTRVYLDCNAPICPYYRPRQTTAAYEEWRARPQKAARRASSGSGRRRVRLDREAPPPSPAALAMAAFSDHREEVAAAGRALLEAELTSSGAMPVLLERFRGGSVKVSGEGLSPDREAPMEAFFARLALVRRELETLRQVMEEAGLAADEKDKVLKDLAGIGGSMTTFNVLLADKKDHFKGSGKG